MFQLLYENYHQYIIERADTIMLCITVHYKQNISCCFVVCNTFFYNRIISTNNNNINNNNSSSSNRVYWFSTRACGDMLETALHISPLDNIINSQHVFFFKIIQLSTFVEVSLEGELKSYHSFNYFKIHASTAQKCGRYVFIRKKLSYLK